MSKRPRSSAAALIVVVGLTACGTSVAPVATQPAPAPGQVPGTAETVTLGPLISGTSSWVDGHLAWTDYAYDDRGRDPGAPYPGGVYASDAASNAADLIQLQLHGDGSILHVRAVLETLKDPSLPLLGIGLDLDDDPQTGAPALPGWNASGTPLGLERLIVASQGVASVMRWTGTDWVESPGPEPRIDADENTIDLDIPYPELGPTGATWRVVGVLGLASSGESWLTDGGRIYDLAYVRDTATTQWQSGLQADILSGVADAAQAMATLAIADFARQRTALALPVPGLQETFLYRSKLKLGEGIQAADRKYAGPYQPYAAWSPETGLPAKPPLIVFLHAALSNHLRGPHGGSQISVGPLQLVDFEMSPAAAIVTPLGRGEVFGWYLGAAEQDVLDVLADAQQRFGSDPDRTVLGGYSLGGVGTFVLAQLHPDLWAAAIDIVGAPDLGLIERLGIAPRLPDTLENLRNLPIRLGHSRLDELQIVVGAIQPDLAALRLHELGYDYRYWQFYLRDHLTFPVRVLQCEFEAAIARGRASNPPRVVYSQEPTLRYDDHDSGLLLRHDSAYWMSELVVRGDSFAQGDKGSIDVSSLALADRIPGLRTLAGAGENLTAGRDVCGDNPEVKTNDVWTFVGQAWDGYADQVTSNGMVADLKAVRSVTLDVLRMGIDVRKDIAVEVSSDGDSLLRLAGPWQGGVAVIDATGVSTATICATEGGVVVPLRSGTSTFVLRQVLAC